MSGGRDLDSVLARFPKTGRPCRRSCRRSTPASISRTGRATPAASASQTLERWLHRQVASDGGTGATLEIGAGTLNSCAFEPDNPAYDIVEPFEELYAASPQRARIREIFKGRRRRAGRPFYARITYLVASWSTSATAPGAGARVRLLAPGGTLRTAIPAKGGFL